MYDVLPLFEFYSLGRNYAWDDVAWANQRQNADDKGDESETYQNRPVEKNGHAAHIIFCGIQLDNMPILLDKHEAQSYDVAQGDSPCYDESRIVEEDFSYGGVVWAQRFQYANSGGLLQNEYQKSADHGKAWQNGHEGKDNRYVQI